MGTSKAQRERISVICKCGCGTEFSAFPVYRSKADGGGLRVPEYCRGHHPNCLKSQTSNSPAWNKGLKKGDHPSIDRMGFQPGHQPYNDWSHVNQQLATDPELKAKWIKSKKGQIAWNTGLTKSQYPNGIATGPDHGNWKGGHRGAIDTATWQDLRRSVLKRDNYTCQHCGDRNRKGRGSRINLEVHHIEAVSKAPDRALDASNLITLCRSCHFKTHNYGSKAVKNNAAP